MNIIFIFGQTTTDQKTQIEKLLDSREILEEFQEFLKHQGKTYGSIEEYNARFAAFKSNIEKIGRKQISAYSKFMDLSKEEFKKKYLNLKTNNLKFLSENKQIEPKTRNLQTSIPKSFDWRVKGIVSSVKDQGDCGCCWAFSANANIEALYAIKYSKILDLSEEQLLDCDTSNLGCDGGAMEDAFKYIKRVGGVMKEGDYRYTQVKDICKFKKNKAVVTISGWFNANTENEQKIAELLVENGPLSAAVNADNMQLYEGGIIDQSDAECPKANINHAILIVGYGEENGNKYWIVKNSWGENWGENGFFRISRGKGTCGINQYVVSAVLGD